MSALDENIGDWCTDAVGEIRYVEMLEQQQVQLVNGLHELYKLVLNGQAWEGPLLNDSGNCRPLTHDILDSLGVLQSDNQSNSGGFEDDLDMMQQRLLANGLDFSHRRDSPDSVTERNPMNSSFLEPTLQQQFSEDGLNAVSLSTPPTTQTPSMNSSWRTSNKSSPVRPHSLQLHSRYSTSHADMISTSLNEQPFYNSPMTYEEGIEFLKLNTLMNLDNASGLQQCSTPMEMTIPTSTLSTWNEEDFTSFLNSTLG